MGCAASVDDSASSDGEHSCRPHAGSEPRNFGRPSAAPQPAPVPGLSPADNSESSFDAPVSLDGHEAAEPSNAARAKALRALERAALSNGLTADLDQFPAPLVLVPLAAATEGIVLSWLPTVGQSPPASPRVAADCDPDGRAPSRLTTATLAAHSFCLKCGL